MASLISAIRGSVLVHTASLGYQDMSLNHYLNVFSECHCYINVNQILYLHHVFQVIKDSVGGIYRQSTTGLPTVVDYLWDRQTRSKMVTQGHKDTRFIHVRATRLA